MSSKLNKPIVRNGLYKKLDVAILGGGIAALWILDRLRQKGYSALLLSIGALGAGQTIASQGIIHSGLKYNIPGFKDLALPALRSMPERWRDCLEGRGEIDLSKASVLSDEIFIHVRAGFASKLKMSIGKHSLHSKTSRIMTGKWPKSFDGSGGELYAIKEMVVDVPSVLQTILDRNSSAIGGIYPDREPFEFNGKVLRIGDCELEARIVIISAGAGNENLMNKLGVYNLPVRKRPLRQIIINGVSEPIYAHVLGANIKPLATITSHLSSNGDWLWYVGGLIAEKGAALDELTALTIARGKLQRLFPAVNFSNANWTTLKIDRAEYGGTSGRPGDSVAIMADGLLVAWPTKLSLAPRLGDLVLEKISARVQPTGGDVSIETLPVSRPAVAPLPWLEIDKWN